MAFEGSSFDLYIDSNLTQIFTGTYDIVNKTNFSDNPQDFTLYIGSGVVGRQLQVASNPGVDNILLTPIDILQEWVADTAYVSGDKVQPISGNGFVYKCISSGTTGGSQPSWPVVTIGTTVVSGTSIWALEAAHHSTTEIKLSLTDGAGLTSATPGAALSLGPAILSTIAEALPIYIRLTNSVGTVTNDIGFEEIAIKINACIETTQ